MYRKKIATLLKADKSNPLCGALKKGDKGEIVDYQYCCDTNKLYAVLVLEDGQTVMTDVTNIKTELIDVIS